MSDLIQPNGALTRKRSAAAVEHLVINFFFRRPDVQENPPHENLPGSHVVGVTVSEDAGKTPTPGEKSRGYRAGHKTRRHHTPIMWTAGENPVRILFITIISG